ncbi:hypothetical protein HK100_005161, partial [Physocladia obscura]
MYARQRQEALTHAQTEQYRARWTKALLDMDLGLLDEMQHQHQHRPLPEDAANQIAPAPSRGVLLMGAGNMVRLALVAVRLLRDAGCVLPVEFAYMPHEVSQTHLDELIAHNITPVNYYTSEIASFKWGKEELRLGAPKPFAVLASSFDQLLFLDPDIYVLRDPTYLFATQIFRKHGALFWPDFPSTTRANPIWKLTNIKFSFEREFESGAMVLDRRKVIRGLKLAAHFCSHADFYFRFIWGDKDAFRWAFKASNTPYFLNPNYLVSLGVAVSLDNPRGNVSLVVSPALSNKVVAGDGGGGANINNNDVEGKNNAVVVGKYENEGEASLPIGAWYCGQNMLQMDFLDKIDASRSELYDYTPEPLFLHANGIKKYYKPDIPPFQIAQTYKKPVVHGKLIDDYHAGRQHWIGMLLGQNHCMRMEVEGGLELIHYDFAKRYPGVNERYMK